MSDAERDNGETAPFYKVREVSKRWGCTDKHVRREIERGKLIAHKFGGLVRISHADCETYERINRRSK